MRSFILASLVLSASLSAAVPQVVGHPLAYGQQSHTDVDAQQNSRPQGYSDQIAGSTQVDANGNVRPDGHYSGDYQYTSGGASGGGYGYGNGGYSHDGFSCPGLQAVPQCCELNALGVVSASCKNPTSPPQDKDSFNDDCAQDGKTAQCCVLPLLAGVGVACNDI